MFTTVHVIKRTWILFQKERNIQKFRFTDNPTQTMRAHHQQPDVHLLKIFLFIALTFGLICLFASSTYRVDEGHVGVCWRGGALLTEVSNSGWNIKMPLIDHCENVQGNSSDRQSHQYTMRNQRWSNYQL